MSVEGVIMFEDWTPILVIVAISIIAIFLLQWKFESLDKKEQQFRKEVGIRWLD
jgi:uncharacterized phage infection (PIP) family protein YhgE